ncbi:unnamed protein product [Staurois parvus]|uniref:Uncharacterized protein n=1 Tax=Staurois parvus TaxID=386267 RepID=A0ABN9B9E1_9NEOB|nr:unnamed protein product [Staurois parvus]
MQRAPRMSPGDLPQPGWQQVRIGELMGGAGAPARTAAPGRGRQPPRGAEISPGFRLPRDQGYYPGPPPALRDPPPHGWQRI